MLLLPTARVVPFTTSVAPEVAPEAEAPKGDSVADPSEVLPAEKVTLPVGAVLPLKGFTVTARWGVAVDAILAGFAVTDVVVPTAEPVTVTAVDADEAAKFPAGEEVALI